MSAFDCTNNLKQHVKYIATEIGERHVRKPLALHRTADYIRQEWTAMGYEVKQQKFITRGVKCENLEITMQGQYNPDEYILICAHYDSSKDCPGANNNATGVAAMLELSRFFSNNNPGCSIRFVALANENPNYYGTEKSGSWHYARQADQRNDNIRTAITLESLGYYSNDKNSQLYPFLMGMFHPKRGNFLAMSSNFGSMTAMYKFAKYFRKHSNFRLETMVLQNLIPTVKWRNSSSFWLNGFPAFTVSDTAEYRYPFYNSSRDTSEKIDYQCLTFVTQGLMRAMTELVNY